MWYFWLAAILAGVILQVLVVAALLKGHYREFRLLFVYCVILLLATVVDVSAYYSPGMWTRTSRTYWVSDAVLQFLIYCVVISLIHRGLENSPERMRIRRFLIVGAVVFTALSLVLTQGGMIGVWMTKLARNLGFCAVILNLILWAVLLKSRHPDRRLLLISGGLGIQMAGKAIGHSLRQISVPTRIPGNLVIVLTHLICLYIWWQTFRASSAGQERIRQEKAERSPRL